MVMEELIPGLMKSSSEKKKKIQIDVNVSD